MAGGIVMNVRFIDTSIMTNLLDIPFLNEKPDKLYCMSLRNYVKEQTDTLILPTATIIETGNHIVHIDDGNVRRSRAEKYSEYLLKTAQDEIPWTYIRYDLAAEDLVFLSSHIVEYAMPRNWLRGFKYYQPI